MDASKIPNSLEKPDVFASEATKRGAVWTKAMCDWVIATAHSNNDKADIKAFLDAANGIVDESTYKYVMATYNSVNGRKEDLPGKIRDVDFITPIKEKYIGEFINTYNNYQVYNADIDVVTRRNADLRVALDGLLRQQFINIMNANGVQTGEPSKMPVLVLMKSLAVCPQIQPVDISEIFDAGTRLSMFSFRLMLVLSRSMVRNAWILCCG